MSEITLVETATLQRVVEVFSRVSWPLPPEGVPAVAEELGWTLTAERRKGIDYATGWPTNSPTATVTFYHGVVGEVSVSVSDWVEGRAEEFGPLTRVVRDRVKSFLGAPTRSRSGRDARYTWDLPGGGAVAIAKFTSSVALLVLPEKLAQLERDEQRLGISDDRVPGPADDLA